MEDKTREAAAIAAALMLARLAHLRFDRDLDAPILPLRSYLHAPAARLLLVPAIAEPCPDLVDEAMSALQADALIVRAAGWEASSITFEVVLRGERLFRTVPLHLWLGTSAPVHLVPNDPTFTSIALHRVGLSTCEVSPWDDDTDRRSGLALGLTHLTRALEGC